MLLKHFYDTRLAQASYLVACQATGEGIVIDPNRDVQRYIEAARSEGVRITHVTETHIHADFVSGSRDLARCTNAALLLSDEGGADWKYDFASGSNVSLLRGGESFMVGNLRFDVLHTPGHTPEHLSFMVTDTPATPKAMGAFTGDFIFVGDVGRPDLLEKAAGARGTMVDAARTLFRSLQRFRTLPDYLQIWPGHGAGSACGKSLGAVPSTTLGYEKLANWALGIDDEERFVEAALEDQPEPPAYFAEMKRVNKQGPPPMGGKPVPPRLPPGKLVELVTNGAPIIDTRPAKEFAGAHVPGTISIPINKSFLTWAGSLVPYDVPLYLIVGDSAVADSVAGDLSLIGLDRIGGYFDSEALAAWTAEGRTLMATPQMDVDALSASVSRKDATIIDVRGLSEWKTGHIPGVPNIPLGSLAERMRDVPRSTPVVVHCQSGSRSAIAASVLEANGFTAVTNVRGGFVEWAASGRAVEQGRKEAG